jgi:hypothetical protein
VLSGGRSCFSLNVPQVAVSPKGQPLEHGYFGDAADDAPPFERRRDTTSRIAGTNAVVITRLLMNTSTGLSDTRMRHASSIWELICTLFLGDGMVCSYSLEAPLEVHRAKRTTASR